MKGVLLDNGDIRPLELEPGQMVLFGGYHSDSNVFKIDGQEHVLMGISDILAIIEE